MTALGWAGLVLRFVAPVVKVTFTAAVLGVRYDRSHPDTRALDDIASTTEAYGRARAADQGRDA